MLITGRDRASVERWFGGLRAGLVAEHGVWLRERDGGGWEMIEPLTSNWKARIRPIMEAFVERVPGSFIEEKEFSLAWHYRKVGTETGLAQARDLCHLLTSITANLEIGVLMGSRVVEVKNIGVNKGRAALRWLSGKPHPFIMAVGDDETDEALFKVLPDEAYSIRVGAGASHARYNIPSWEDVRKLLGALA